ncbi:MAG: hypothetical protein K2N29_00695 [Ruminiclostridium sp.]|nr:hypothetical protein [Ruminiclostridium sp.]
MKKINNHSVLHLRAKRCFYTMATPQFHGIAFFEGVVRNPYDGKLRIKNKANAAGIERDGRGEGIV